MSASSRSASGTSSAAGPSTSALGSVGSAYSRRGRSSARVMTFFAAEPGAEGVVWAVAGDRRGGKRSDQQARSG